MARFPIAFGRHLLLERINVGGMAEVFKAKAFGVEGFERIVAVKRILPTLVEDEEFTTMFIDEARIAAHLTHQNIVQIYELQKHAGLFFISMEYIAGRDLRQILDAQAGKERTAQDIAQASYIVSRVLEALEYAHGKRDAAGRDLKIVHRDVTPQNIIISYEGEVKLCDFGIAKAASRVGRTQVGVLKGKFAYMSPEQVKGQDTDHRGDLFSLGVVFYEMLTGRRLFVGESDYATLEAVREAVVPPPRGFNTQITPELEAIVLRLLARDPEDRYASASDALEALLDYASAAGPAYHRRHLRDWMQQIWTLEIEVENASLERFMALKHPAAGMVAAREFSSQPSSQEAAGVQEAFGGYLSQIENDETEEFGGRTDSPVASAPRHEARVLPAEGPGPLPGAARPVLSVDEPVPEGSSGVLRPEDGFDPLALADDDEGAFEQDDRTDYDGDRSMLFADEQDATLLNTGTHAEEARAAQAKLLAYIEQAEQLPGDETVDFASGEDPSAALDPAKLAGAVSPPETFEDPEPSGDETVLQPLLTTLEPGEVSDPALFGANPLLDEPRPEDPTASEDDGTVEAGVPVIPSLGDPSRAEFEDLFRSDKGGRDGLKPYPVDLPSELASSFGGEPGAGSPPPSIGGPRRIIERMEQPGLTSTRSMQEGDAVVSATRPVVSRTRPIPDLSVLGQPKVIVLLAAGVMFLTAVMVAALLTWSQPHQATLSIRTEPEVPFILRVDGRRVAEGTSSEAVGLDIGSHRIEIEAPGYAPYVQTIQIGEAKPHTMVVPLTSVEQVPAGDEGSEAGWPSSGSPPQKSGLDGDYE